MYWLDAFLTDTYKNLYDYESVEEMAPNDDLMDSVGNDAHSEIMMDTVDLSPSMIQQQFHEFLDDVLDEYYLDVNARMEDFLDALLITRTGMETVHTEIMKNYIVE